MAWTTPSTVVAGQTLSAAFWNEQVRDNENFLYTPPAAKIARSATQTITNNSNTAIAFTAGASYDTDTMFSAGSNTILTIKTAGLYLINGFCAWASNATGIRYLTVQIGSSNTTISLGINPMNGFVNDHSISGVLKLSVNNTIRLMAFQSSGGDLNVNTAELSATWIGSG